MKTFLVLLISVSCAFAVYDACNYLNDCWDCTQVAGCAWCESNVGVCMSNTSASNCQALASPQNANFVRTTANCVASFPNCTAKFPTDNNATCMGCAADPDCGWCYTTGLGGTCRGKNFANVGCNFAQGIWVEDSTGVCPASNSLTCRDYLSCTDCAADSKCGWCQAPSYDRNCFELGENVTKAQYTCTNPTVGFGGIWQNNLCVSYPTCPVSGQTARGNPITYCNLQANVGCCNVSMDSSISAAVSTAVSVFGSGCAANFKTLFCTSMCDSTMGTWANATVVKIESGYADRLYCTCVSSSALKTTYATREAFFAALSNTTSLRFAVSAQGFNQTSPPVCATTSIPTTASSTMLTPLFTLFLICFFIISALLQ